MELADLTLDQSWQYAAYVILFLVTLIFTILLLPSSAVHFRRFYGEPNPIAVLVVTALIGGASLWFLQVRYGFSLFGGGTTLRGMAVSAGFATLLAIAIVVADFIIRYPQDLNVPVPQALLFYPAIGFVAEIIFHILPLALLLFILSPLVGRLGRERVIGLSVVLVAIFEPTFQVLLERKALTWGSAYTWFHVFAIAILQLHVFRRFDFMSMYSFRLFYYAYWHILWGVIRLKVLF
jgi:hypothetical protein